ncbi:class I SAM-dependent DNA methyltransferase [Rubrobacter indicoceani]|uniref:class I SAM-dependent DNA methyltransferase n=1 Tax=Rubrobacter indicoceani TaxID=2051957 RepID=UPI0013C44690|nr:class I SAM-dependent methyltransferase [Rubrobacter indicoceani]
MSKTPSIKEVRRLWDRKASYWDRMMGDGNAFQETLISPTTERLLGGVSDRRILEIACGNGVMTRRLAALGAEVLATDLSETFLELARLRRAENAGRIEYRLADATDEAQLLALGHPSGYDAAVCSMALMDLPEIEPLFRSLAKLLRPGAPFVFSVQHPCFNSNAATMVSEGSDRDGKPATENSVRVSGYLNVPPGRGAGMPGEPNPHFYFHRPLHELLGAGFANGFIVDGLEEPGFPEETDAPYPSSWRSIREIPPVLVVRMKRA